MKYLIFYCDVEWSIFNRREFILELAKQHPEIRVVVINRPAALIPNIFRRKKRSSILQSLTLRPVNVEGNLIVVRPLTLLHDLLGARIFNGWGNFIQRYFIQFYLILVGVRPSHSDDVYLWVYEQTQWQLSKLFSSSKKTVVWEIFDDYRLTAQGDPRGLWVACEPSMLKCTDHIFTLTDSLREKYVSLHDSVSVMGNGYPSDTFMPLDDVPSDLMGITNPIIMYLGTIRDWIDFELLEQVLVENSRYTFVFVGPIISNVEEIMQKLSKYSNFIYLGAKERKDVPKYMSAADVAIIPYLQNKFTASVKPIKLYEFLACGTPVVTTTTADISHIPGAIYISSKSDIGEQLRSALNEGCKFTCIEVAAEWSWASVAQTVSDKIGLNLRGRCE